jgi:hypothetical protein
MDNSARLQDLTCNSFAGNEELSRSCIGLEGIAGLVWSCLAVAVWMWHRLPQHYRCPSSSLSSIPLPTQQLALSHRAEQL